MYGKAYRVGDRVMYAIAKHKEDSARTDWHTGTVEQVVRHDGRVSFYTVMRDKNISGYSLRDTVSPCGGDKIQSEDSGFDKFMGLLP